MTTVFLPSIGNQCNCEIKFNDCGTYYIANNINLDMKCEQRELILIIVCEFKWYHDCSHPNLAFKVECI